MQCFVKLTAQVNVQSIFVLYSCNYMHLLVQKCNSNVQSFGYIIFVYTNIQMLYIIVPTTYKMIPNYRVSGH